MLKLQLLRDRIEILEDALKDSKVKMVKMQRENQRMIEKVRYFWWNTNSRGELLKAALVYPDHVFLETYYQYGTVCIIWNNLLEVLYITIDENYDIVHKCILYTF